MRNRRGAAGARLTWPVPHGTALRVLVPLADVVGQAPAFDALPTLAQVGRGWEAHLARGLRLSEGPSPRLAATADAAVRRFLVTGLDGRDGLDGALTQPERALLVVALAVAGFAGEAAELVSRRAARRPPELLVRQALELASLLAAPWDNDPVAMAAASGPGGAWPSAHRGDDPAHRAAYLLALRDLLVVETDQGLDLLGTPGASRLLGITAGTPPSPHPPATEKPTPPAAAGASRLLEIRGVAGEGSDAAQAPAPPALEVHRLGTRSGSLSFALRWHGDRPALLWELVPPSNRLETWAAGLTTTRPDLPTPPGQPQLTISALSKSWRTSELTGETLL